VVLQDRVALVVVAQSPATPVRQEILLQLLRLKEMQVAQVTVVAHMMVVVVVVVGLLAALLLAGLAVLEGLVPPVL